MFREGLEVVVVGFPPENDRRWGIPLALLGKRGVIVRISNKYIIVEMYDSGDEWNFPLNPEGVLSPFPINRWNPLGYKSRFEPLKLP